MYIMVKGFEISNLRIQIPNCYPIIRNLESGILN